MQQYAKIRRRELQEFPEVTDEGSMLLHNQVERICKEWDSYTQLMKLRFKKLLAD